MNDSPQVQIEPARRKQLRTGEAGTETDVGWVVRGRKDTLNNVVRPQRPLTGTASLELRFGNLAGKRTADEEPGACAGFQITAIFQQHVRLQRRGYADALLPAEFAQRRRAIAGAKHTALHLSD